MTLQNTTPFSSLTDARMESPIVTRQGKLVKFIAYVPESRAANQRVLFSCRRADSFR